MSSFLETVGTYSVLSSSEVYPVPEDPPCGAGSGVCAGSGTGVCTGSGVFDGVGVGAGVGSLHRTVIVPETG